MHVLLIILLYRHLTFHKKIRNFATALTTLVKAAPIVNVTPHRRLSVGYECQQLHPRAISQR